MAFKQGKNSVKTKKEDENPVDNLVSAADLIELKRDMQSAKVVDWLHANQQQLIAGAVVFVLVLIGASLWKEQRVAQREAAALAYMQATNIKNADERYTMFEAVRTNYPDSGYALLASMQQSKSNDVAVKKASLQVLIDSKSMPELKWQAQLDLAELLIHEGGLAEAAELLKPRAGKHYEQQRFYLLSQTTTDAGQKAEWIEKSLAAESHDNDLTAALEAELASLQVVQ